jgi:hypothetical protein
VLINIVSCADVHELHYFAMDIENLNRLIRENSKLLCFLLNYSRRLVASLFFIVDNRFFQRLGVELLVFSRSYLSSFLIL